MSAEASTVQLGDPVPWFSGHTVTGHTIDLHVQAGRWIVLAFLGDLDTPRAAHELAGLLEEAELLDPEHLVIYGILATAPSVRTLEMLCGITGPALAFFADGDGSIARAFGAEGSPRTLVLDAMLRAVVNLAHDETGESTTALRQCLRALPRVDEAAGVPLSAPILMVPRVFEFELCDFLIDIFDRIGGTDSGFMLDRDGVTGTVIDHKLKRRTDLVISDPELRATLKDRIVRRLLPPLERFFQYRATRMDRTMVCCYDSATGGHFYRHRDDMNAGARHRRFAVSLNLNGDYDGGDLVMPEFGSRAYRAPAGGAMVFSCSALHAVTPITRGRRFAFVPFLYGEADVATREANNSRLGAAEAQYVAGYDRLFD
jgi:peroxiredoxin